MRIDGYIVANKGDEDFYRAFGVPAICPETVREALDKGDRSVNINSYGGSVWAATEIYQMLKDIEGIIVTVDGIAASAATIIMCAGEKVRFAPSAVMMIHNASTMCEGDYRDMEKGAEMLQVINKTVRIAYQTRTNATDEELSQLMDAETWMDAHEAKERGFCDEITGEEMTHEVLDAYKNSARQVFASLKPPDLSKLKKENQSAEQIGADNSSFLLQIQINKNLGGKV